MNSLKDEMRPNSFKRPRKDSPSWGALPKVKRMSLPCGPQSSLSRRVTRVIGASRSLNFRPDWSSGWCGAAGSTGTSCPKTREPGGFPAIPIPD